MLKKVVQYRQINKNSQNPKLNVKKEFLMHLSQTIEYQSLDAYHAILIVHQIINLFQRHIFFLVIKAVTKLILNLIAAVL